MVMENYTIIISTFNEEDTIEECLDRVAQASPQAEIILLHGGKDRTAEIARGWGRARNHPIKVLENYGDCGKGHAIKAGITIASHPVMMQFDADLQFAPEDIPKLVEPVLKGEADLVVGSRFMKEADRSSYQFSLFRDLGNGFLNRFMSLLAGQKITDVTTGSKVWNRKAIWEINFRDNRFIYEMEIVLRGALKGYRIVQLPVSYSSRQGGASGHGTGLKEFCSIARTGFLIAFKGLLIRLKLW